MIASISIYIKSTFHDACAHKMHVPNAKLNTGVLPVICIAVIDQEKEKINMEGHAVID